MKRLMIIFIGLIILLGNVVGQDLKDTKEYIIDRIEGNSSGCSYFSNHVVFDINTSVVMLQELIGRKVSNDFYKYVLVYVFEQFSNPAKSQLEWISNYCIDFRAVEKVSTYPVTGNNCTDYAIALSLNDNYPNYYIWESPSGAKKVRGMSENKLKIFISNDKETASKLKKAIIHLGSLYNITIMDGDMF